MSTALCYAGVLCLGLAALMLCRGYVLRAFDRFLEACDNLLDRTRTAKMQDTATAAVLLLPTFMVLGVFGIFPLFYAFYLSLYDTRRGVFVALGNYTRALSTSEFWNSFLVTVYYAVGTIPVCMVVSFTIALCLFRIVRGRSLFRTVYFLPYVTSVVASATVWRVILSPQTGLANVLLAKLGFPAQMWLLEPRGVLHLLTGGWVSPRVGPSLGLCCIILFEVWYASGFMIVIFLAGLSAIPRELEEAAVIDGASRFQLIRRIILPLLSPTVFFLSVVSSIKAFQAFNSFYALTNKARGEATQNLTVYIYAMFYENQRLGYGAAVATLLSLAIVCLTLLQWRYVGRRVHYE